MNVSTGLLGEAELHGLVDGHLAADHRAGVLRKLAASPADRARVEAWQEQNDLIRAAFRDVERETLPVALDLAPPRLRCVENDPDQPLAPIRAMPLEPSAPRHRNAFAGVAAVLVVTVGLAGAWLVGQSRDDDAPDTTPAPVADQAPPLAERAMAALDAAPRPAASSLTQARVPDLSSAGLRLTDVSTRAGEPGSMVLHYSDAGDGRVVLGLAGTSPGAPARATDVDGTIAWHHGGTAYALAGTLPAERLRKLARSLQDETGHD